MKQLLSFYFILSYSIGLLSLVILFMAFRRSGMRVLYNLFWYLLLLTILLVVLTYVEYRHANTSPGFTTHVELLQYILLCFLVIPCLYLIFILMKKFHALTDANERIFFILTAIGLGVEICLFFIPGLRAFPECGVVYAAGYFYWNVLLLKYITGKFFTGAVPGDDAIMSNDIIPNPSMKEAINRLKLTDREKEVLLLVAQGQPNREIAVHLFITEDTVKTHIKNIYKKLGVNNRVQLLNLLKEDKF